MSKRKRQGNPRIAPGLLSQALGMGATAKAGMGMVAAPGGGLGSGMQMQMPMQMPGATMALHRNGQTRPGVPSVPPIVGGHQASPGGGGMSAPQGQMPAGFQMPQMGGVSAGTPPPAQSLAHPNGQMPAGFQMPHMAHGGLLARALKMGATDYASDGSVNASPGGGTNTFNMSGQSLANDLFGSSPQTYNPNSSLAQAATNENTYGANQAEQNQIVSYGNRAAPTAQAAQSQGGNFNNYSGANAQEGGLANQLISESQGQGPSAAQMAGQQSRDASLNQAAALQAGQRGHNAAQAATAGAMASSQGIQQANQTQAQGQAGEMANAATQAGNVLGTMGSQGLQYGSSTQQNNQFNAGNQQQTNLANQSAQLQQTGLNQQGQLSSEQMLNQQGANEMNNQMTNNEMAYSNLQPGNPGMFGSMLSGFTSGLQLAHGDVVKRPQRVLVGEAGPEAIIHPSQIVTRPTVMDLGHDSPAAVIPLGPGHRHDQDRSRVVHGALSVLLRGQGAPTDHADGGGVYSPYSPTNAPGQLPGTIGIGTRTTPNWNGTGLAGITNGMGTLAGKTAADATNAAYQEAQQGQQQGQSMMSQMGPSVGSAALMAMGHGGVLSRHLRGR